ncbi:MAG: ATP-binding cassette domain-containing protein [Defluviitaleaceae bacterium]|nr:ATP-binding cassette domain-containing protein [Defluviitaleaceae bacterium]MCL2275750.1 ATP-binding cassette domain-containing protein [Defluviitaleaceae bacterium]
MIQVTGLTKKYGKHTANDDIHFTLDAGALGVLLGPNGAGKTTLIKSICGLLRFSGSVLIDGHDNRSMEAKRVLGYVPEIAVPYPMLTVAEHLEFIARAYRLDDWHARAEALLQRFELADLRNKLGNALSKGMKQKVSICCALLPNPKAIVFDEPLSGLDPHGIRELQTAMAEMRNEGRAGGVGALDMADVNLAFTAPVKPRTLLLYGLVQSMRAMCIVCVTAVFWGFLVNAFLVPIPVMGYVFLAVGGLLIGFSSRLMGLFVYAVTVNKPEKAEMAKTWTYMLFAPLVIGLAFFWFHAGGNLRVGLEGLLASPVFQFTPFAGWGAAGVVAFIEGEAGRGLVFFGLLLVTGLFFFWGVHRSNPDFYEDVHVEDQAQAESENHSAGFVQLMGTATDKTKLRGTGLRGTGSRVFFFKHIREARRVSAFISMGLIFWVVCALAWAMLNRTNVLSENFPILGDIPPIITLLAVLMLFKSIFFVVSGRGILELFSHYLYLIPEKMMTKIFWANGEAMVKTAADAVIIILPAGLLMGTYPIAVAAAMVTYITMLFMMLGLTLGFLTFSGGKSFTSSVLPTVFTLLVMALMIPGGWALWALTTRMGGAVGLMLGLLALAAWQLLLGAVGLLASHKALENGDMPVY